ncbi:hypothetical protein EW026_g3729 [Hermanssonia centrifuga]|uniref:P-loop containing nucleoside triphosphate hydrolase protein n=1 Tax=Hermanssonia centrifuga TaxID=98765 RepID=A0A4S4KL88_9APHY|nr:hypothetical protein EW026_g3729 [Hermanssonia centrifuga]
MIGKINNLVTTDLAALESGQRTFLLVLFYTPFHIVVSVIFLYVILDWSVFVGVGVMILLSFLPGIVTKLSHKVQKEKMKKSDARVQTVTEIVIQAQVALDRINDFLSKTELLDAFSGATEYTSLGSGYVSPNVIGIRAASFSWDKNTHGTETPGRNSRNFKLCIKNEVIFKREQINLIIGQTGSGKTSLLMALLGEMHYVPMGPNSMVSLPREGGVAYHAQESWVLNETIRNNILFGSPYIEERYKKVIEQCALERDLSLFDAGDDTEVGEKGITLSGGQKARITLARAVYSQAAILVLDDVLAALDVHTAQWIVEKCFKGDLIQGRTVILVTHNVALAAPIADFVVCLSVDGGVLSTGSLSSALAKDEKLSAEIAKESKALEKGDSDINMSKPDVDGPKASGKLVVEEEIAVGHVGWTALKLLFSNTGSSVVGLIFFWAINFGFLFISKLSIILGYWVLALWAKQYEISDPSEISVPRYLSLYAAIYIFSVITVCIGYTVFIVGTLRASRVIHKLLIDTLLRSTWRWLDITPSSRIIARCTQDIAAIDTNVVMLFNHVTQMTFDIVLKFFTVIIMSPTFTIPGLLVGVIGGWLGQVFMRAQLAVKRELSNAKSPVLGHFGAAISGSVSVRAYGAEEAFRQESFLRINRYTRVTRTYWNLDEWVTVRAELLGGVFSAALAAYLVYGRQADASDTGFSITIAVSFSTMIIHWVNSFNTFEVQGNSLERLHQYLLIEQEPKPTEDGIPPAHWPSSGDLRVEDLSARYSPDGPEVLHNITFHVKSGERVGIVGRTGSGKSSLTLALLRCILTKGKVYYDGLATDSVNLDALRSQITIIPQVPELLAGTLRENIDPFGQYEDAILNDALRAAGLFSLQSKTNEARLTLDSAISSGGGNISIGQRQIIALARAIVRQSKLLILDEATSAIDYETDSVIQESLRKEVAKDVTLLTIAHRLQTIMDSDMVLDAGRIVEFGKPSKLLENAQGFLRSLVDASGDKERLHAMVVDNSST